MKPTAPCTDIDSFAAALADKLQEDLNAEGIGQWEVSVGKADRTGQARSLDLRRDGADAGFTVLVRPQVMNHGGMSLGADRGTACLFDTAPASLASFVAKTLPDIEVVPEEKRWIPGSRSRLWPIPERDRPFAEERMTAIKAALRQAGLTDISVTMGAVPSSDPVLYGEKTEIAFLFRKRGAGVCNTYLIVGQERSFLYCARFGTAPEHHSIPTIQRPTEALRWSTTRLCLDIKRFLGAPEDTPDPLVQATFGS